MCDPPCANGVQCVVLLDQSRSCGTCPLGTYVATPYTSSTSLVCHSCTAGTYTQHSQSSGCQACVSGTFSTVNGATSALSCAPWTVCRTGFTASVAPTASTDRTCVPINACIDFPCSVFSGGCTPSMSPTGDNAQSRTCAACNAGYVGDGSTCVNSLLVPPTCNCAAEVGWVTTPCNGTDSKPCASGSGVQTRACAANGDWLEPSTEQCFSSSLFYCCFICDVHFEIDI